MMSCPVFGADDVRSLLDYEGCIDAVREAMARFSADGIAQPLRSIFAVGEGKSLALMPGALSAPGGLGAKIITVFRDPERPGRSAHRGIVVLFDRNTGEVRCLADAGEITHVRTAAASAVATDALARSDAHRLAIFGCGAQAASHVRALSRVRDLTQVVIWGRERGVAEAFATRMAQETSLPVRAEPDARAAAAQADIICTVTGSPTPVLEGKWVRPGTHVNLVGSSYAVPTEVDSELVISSRFIVDSRQSALVAAAEFLIAKKAGLVDDRHIAGEIGEVLIGRVAGRTSPEQVTVYKSLGHVVQDLAAITYLYERVRPRSAARSPA
jgi:ornithine cyclodeaminase